MNTPVCLTLSRKLSPEVVGGKAAALSSLIGAGLPVPPAFVVAAGTTTHNLMAHEADILNRFDNLQAHFAAVRSSAVAEDGTSASWAGQLETILGVTRATLMDAIATCLDSADSVHAREYAKLHNSAGNVAVIVQRLVQARTAGVMFTTNPVTGNQGEMMIEAVAGLGETLVQGLASPESWVILRQTGAVINHTDPDQPMQLKIGPAGTLTSPNSTSTPYLSTRELSQLIKLGIQLEQHFGRPQDIEWAIEDHQLYILQSRPITTL